MKVSCVDFADGEFQLTFERENQLSFVYILTAVCSMQTHTMQCTRHYAKLVVMCVSSYNLQSLHLFLLKGGHVAA